MSLEKHYLRNINHIKVLVNGMIGGFFGLTEVVSVHNLCSVEI